MPVANILDPIHDSLPASVWDRPHSLTPHLKPQHRKWIQATVIKVLTGAGYTHMDQWLSLVLTGSLTTYQYGKESDCDVSLFVDTEHFPEWSRAEMIGLMIAHVDGTRLPGTTYPMQCFVVPPDVQKHDLYRPGLRSGYDLETDQWIEPPDPSRVHDVQREYNDLYIYALEQADKMERLLRYEPDKAKMLWHQIHQRRRRDQMAGKGDYSESNIVYKFLANRGLFPAISDATGEYIAKQAAPTHRTVTKFVYDPVENHIVLGKTGAEEGEHESHYDLINSAGINPSNAVFGQFDPQGRIETFGRPLIRGFDQPEVKHYEADHKLKQALEHAVPGIRYTDPNPLFQKWDLDSPPQITYMGDPPTVTPDASNQSPSEEGVWQF
jgi:hypothetical protein